MLAIVMCYRRHVSKFIVLRPDVVTEERYHVSRSMLETGHVCELFRNVVFRYSSQMFCYIKSTEK